MTKSNRKPFREIHEEIRAFQAQHEGSREANSIGWVVLLPAFIRRLFLGIVFKSPQMLKELIECGYGLGEVALPS